MTNGLFERMGLPTAEFIQLATFILLLVERLNKRSYQMI